MKNVERFNVVPINVVGSLKPNPTFWGNTNILLIGVFIFFTLLVVTFFSKGGVLEPFEETIALGNFVAAIVCWLLVVMVISLRLNSFHVKAKIVSDEKVSVYVDAVLLNGLKVHGELFKSFTHAHGVQLVKNGHTEWVNMGESVVNHASMVKGEVEVTFAEVLTEIPVTKTTEPAPTTVS